LNYYTAKVHIFFISANFFAKTSSISGRAHFYNEKSGQKVGKKTNNHQKDVWPTELLIENRWGGTDIAQ